MWEEICIKLRNHWDQLGGLQKFKKKACKSVSMIVKLAFLTDCWSHLSLI